MKTNYIISADGAKIAYNITGKGPALVLVHGMGESKKMWVDYGWVEIFKKYFTVISIDIRGYGESDKSYDSNFYTIEKILKDLDFIVKECGFNEYNYFGHSYGATIGLQAGKQNNNIKKVICAGTAFGDNFFKVMVPQWISQYKELNEKKKRGKLYELNLSAEDIKRVNEIDIELRIAQFKAWKEWEGVEPKDIKSELAIYSGTKDTPQVLEQLYTYEDEIKQCNIAYKVFPELNHFDLVHKSEVVYSWVLDHLFQSRSISFGTLKA